MTSHYLDVRLLPDPELAPHQLLGALYSRLHRALATLDSQDIGVSFPEYDERRPSLGKLLRLHGTEPSLQRLVGTAWLTGMQDHVKLAAIAPVPEGCRHRVVNRVQVKSNVDRLRRRAMKRHGLDEAAAAQRIPYSAEKRAGLPFVVLGSRSTGQAAFPLFIDHGPLLSAPVEGTFGSYGLSRQATIPWF